jgi:hypothetical protein
MHAHCPCFLIESCCVYTAAFADSVNFETFTFSTTQSTTHLEEYVGATKNVDGIIVLGTCENVSFLWIWIWISPFCHTTQWFWLVDATIYFSNGMIIV